MDRKLFDLEPVSLRNIVRAREDPERHSIAETITPIARKWVLQVHGKRNVRIF